VHAKIRSVSFEDRETPGIADALNVVGHGDARVFATATTGGLARYWGQQFVRYDAGDPWPNHEFASHRDYSAACAEMERLFVISPDLERGSAGTTIWHGGYVRKTPRLLIGTPGAPRSGLAAMAHAFESVTRERGANVLPLRAVAFSAERDNVKTKLSDGSLISSRKLVLAAGVIGTLRLVGASCDDIERITFRDHAPQMLYALQLGRVLELCRNDDLAHFNRVTLERQERAACRLFASVYDMRFAAFSLVTCALGLPPLLRGWNAPGYASLVSVLQVWTLQTFETMGWRRGTTEIEVVRPTTPDRDLEFDGLLTELRRLRVRLKRASTGPGGGFHYHAAAVSTAGATDLPLDGFLDERFRGAVSCVDASILPAIGCRPHTLTAMAVAASRARKDG
jgi:hypothetical protein